MPDVRPQTSCFQPLIKSSASFPPIVINSASLFACSILKKHLILKTNRNEKTSFYLQVGFCVSIISFRFMFIRPGDVSGKRGGRPEEWPLCFHKRDHC